MELLHSSLTKPKPKNTPFMATAGEKGGGMENCAKGLSGTTAATGDS